MYTFVDKFILLLLSEERVQEGDFGSSWKFLEVLEGFGAFGESLVYSTVVIGVLCGDLRSSIQDDFS